MNKQLLRAMGFGKQVDRLENNQCPICGAPIHEEDFRDRLSVKEYKISGMCQKCQDKIYG